MPSSVSDADLLMRFREIGEESINSLLLTYFRAHLGNDTLRMDSRVFPRPTNSDVIVANQLAVRKCLSDNWQGIQDAYPCLYNFEYVLGEADFLYTIRYPYVEIDTWTVRIVETVHDFVEFIFDFIQNLCMPCILKSDKSCEALRKKMIDALELCAEEGCTETRRNLLNFVIENVAKTDPTSSTTNMDPGVFTGAKAVVKPVNRGVGFLTEENQAKRIGDRFMAEYAQKNPFDAKNRFVSNHYKVELPVMNELFNLLNILQRHGKSITKTVANRYVQEVVGLRKDFIVIINEGPGPDFQLFIENVFVVDTKENLLITGHMARAFEEDMNKVRNAMWKNGDISLAVRLVRNYQLQEVPYDWSVRGMFDENNDFHAKYIVYVVGKNLYCQDINKMMNAHDGAKMLMDKQVKSKRQNSDTLKFVVQDTGGKDGGENSCTPNEHEVLDLSDLRPSAVSQNAMILTEALWGPEETFLDPETFRKVVIFLDESMRTDDTKGTSELYKMFSLLTNQNTIREAVLAVDGDGDIHHTLARAKQLTSTSEGIKKANAGHSMDIVDKFVLTYDSPLACLMDAPAASEQVEDSINAVVQGWLAADAPRLLDDMLLRDVVGWGTYMEYRDTIKRAEELGLDMSDVLLAKKNALDKAYKATRIVFAKGPDIGMLPQLMRKEFRGELDALPREFESLGLITSYHQIKMNLPKPEKRELFVLNAYKMVYSLHAERVDEVSYEGLEAFAQELSYNLHSSMLSSEHHPARTYFEKAKLFLAFYTAVWVAAALGMYLHRPKKDNNGVPVNNPLHVRRVRGIKLTGHGLVVLGGFCGGHMDKTMLHFLLFAMFHVPDMAGWATQGRRGTGDSGVAANLRRHLADLRKKREVEQLKKRIEELETKQLIEQSKGIRDNKELKRINAALTKARKAGRLLTEIPSTYRDGRVIGGR